MTFIPTAGNVAILKIGTSILPGTDWTLSKDAKVTTAPSNFRDGRVAVATLGDAQLRFTLVWDSNGPPTLATGENLRDGATVTVDCYTDASNFFVFPGVVSLADISNGGLEGVVTYAVTVQLSGVITFPVNG